MKVAAVFTGRDHFSDAGIINALISGIRMKVSRLEIWVLVHETPPTKFPKMDIFPSLIRLISLVDPDLPEAAVHAVEEVCRTDLPDILIFGSTGFDRELCSRLCCRLESQSCLWVEGMEPAGQGIEIKRPAYAGNLGGKFIAAPGGLCLSAAPKPLEPLKLTPWDSQTIKVEPSCASSDWILSRDLSPGPADTGLETAGFVVAAGMGVGSGEGMAQIEKITKTLGATLGGSRPAVMSGWLTLDRMIGVSGKTISPAVCIAAGVSGAGAFARGIDPSQFILAVNHDEKAPIFFLADAGVVEDLYEFLHALAEVIDEDR